MPDEDVVPQDAVLFYHAPDYRGPRSTDEALVREDYETRWQRSVYEHLFRDLLTNIDHQEGDYHLTHLGILRRLHAVIGREIARLEGAVHHA